MFDIVRRIFIRPVDFFRELAEDERKKERAVWVVLLVILVHAAAMLAFALPQARLFPPGSVAATTMLVSAAVLAGISVFLGWVIDGLVVRMTAGMEAKPWAVAGYSTAPWLVASLLMLLAAVLFPVDLVPLDSYDDPRRWAEMQAAVQQSVSGRIIAILTYLQAIWYFVLIFIGVRETTRMRHRAARAVTVLVLIYFARIVLPTFFTPVF